ncbi:MAG: tRNA 4-thiouridine(8) synthase ThiI [Firmicutes bacterium]|nr:tRNA 4-thiouridine(8) synthase ThiI [Bacillota bacterium]
MEKRILIRYGEIGLKGRNRRWFEDQLLANLRKTLNGLPVEIVKTQERILLKPSGTDAEEVWNARELYRRLGRVFGLVSFSPVIKTESKLESITAAAVTLFQEKPARTFKVESRRADKTFPIPSLELSRTLGGLLLDRFPETRVDVHTPELLISVEVRKEAAYIYGESIPGLGGLPVGVAGRCLLLLSGGIDSPVAGWMTMKRGARVEALHFHHYPFTSERAQDKVKELWQVLRNYGAEQTVRVVNIGEIQNEIVKSCPEKFRVTLLRRMMFRIASRIAEREGHLALVTGESIGQVASQTIESMRVINEVTNLPILRPLAGMDKSEIIERAIKIGTYELSIQPYDDCCTLFLPRSPETRPNLENIKKAEQALEIERLVDDAVESLERWDIPLDVLY